MAKNQPDQPIEFDSEPGFEQPTPRDEQETAHEGQLAGQIYSLAVAGIPLEKISAVLAIPLLELRVRYGHTLSYAAQIGGQVAHAHLETVLATLSNYDLGRLGLRRVARKKLTKSEARSQARTSLLSTGYPLLEDPDGTAPQNGVHVYCSRCDFHERQPFPDPMPAKLTPYRHALKCLADHIREAH